MNKYKIPLVVTIATVSLLFTTLSTQARQALTPVSETQGSIAMSQPSSVGKSASQGQLAQAAPEIEVAQLSGVTGYPIGIFGANFGTTAGTVTILGQTAAIVEWTPTFIRVEVPAVADGTGNLTVTTASGQAASQPFEVYTIDPVFQRPLKNRFINIMRGKTAIVQNGNDFFCYEQPGDAYLQPADFITDFRCGFVGIIGDGEVDVTLPSPGGSAISVDIGETLLGEYYFQFFSSPTWYSYWASGPATYDIQVSADSTNGVDGTWLTLHTEVGNTRASRLHKIDVPSGGYQWVRISVTNGIWGSVARFKEIRLYQSTTDAESDLDMMTVYGDSITEGAFYHIGATGFSQSVSNMLGSVDEPILSVYGLPGQGATGFVDNPNVNTDMFDAFALDEMGSRARYWGLAVGNNDTGEADNDLGIPGTNIEEFDERLDAMVQLMVSQNKVPLIHRIPDTDEAISTDVIATKRKILGDIDTVAARYRLIPGPDLYTLIRLNIERDDSSWFWPGDPYHQNWTGRLKIIEAWADALIQGTNRSALGAGEQPPSAVTQVGPLGSNASATPNFVWQPEATATGYQVLLYRQDTQTVLWTEYVDALESCGQLECSYQHSTESGLTPAPYLWLIRAFNAAGFGPWSSYP